MKIIKIINWFKENQAALIVLMVVLGLFTLVEYASLSFWDSINATRPDCHYEDGVKIITVRGQDFIVSGTGEYRSLVPVAPLVFKTNNIQLEK